jgi:hypothetical protein
MGGETTKIEAEQIGSMRVQTSAYGMVIPLVYGRTRIAGNLMEYADFKAIATTEESGGKGGGGVEQTTYTYYAAVAMGLCEGPIGDVRAVWRGKQRLGDGHRNVFYEPHVVPVSAPYTVTIPDWVADGATSIFGGLRLSRSFGLPSDGQYTVSAGVYTFPPSRAGQTVYLTYTKRIPVLLAAGFTIFRGDAGQAPWPYMATAHPDRALTYPGVAYIAAGGYYQLTDSASLENHSFEVIGRLPYNTAAGIYDANPRDVMLDFLSNPIYGAAPGFPIDGLRQFSDYCLAAGILISPSWADQRPAHEFIDELCKIGNSAPVWSEGKLKVIPFADAPIIGALASYSPNVTPLYDLTDDDFQPNGAEPVRVRRKTQADAFNQVQIEFTNRTNDYNVDIAEAKDQADIEQYGLRPMQPLKLASVCDASVADIIASITRDRALYVRNEYEFQLGWRYALLEPMDIVTITDAALGLDKTPVRIREVSESEDGEISIVAEEFLFGVAAPTAFPSTIPEGYNADYNVSPGSVSAPVMFEPPIEKTRTGLEVWAAVSAVSPVWGGCDVWVSLDNATYKYVGTVKGGSRYGTLKAGMAQGALATASVALDGAGGQLLPATLAEAESLMTLCWVGDVAGGEFFAYQGAALVAADEYDLTGLVRGAYGTTDTSHLAGLKFVRVDDRLAKSEPLDMSMIGKTVYFKFASFNIWGTGKEDLADVVAYPYTITGAMAKLPPSDVAGFTATTTPDRILLAWNAVPDVDLAEYEIREGQTWTGAPAAARARSTQMKFSPRLAGTYHFMVKAVDQLGNYSGAPAMASMTITPPPAVAVTVGLADGDYALSWDAPVSSFWVDYYEIRHGSSWGAGTVVTRANAQSHKAKVDWFGARTFWVAAVDVAGNIGTPASASLTVNAAVAPVVALDLVGAQVALSWTAPNGSLPTAEYEVRHGATWAGGTYVATLTARSMALNVDWSGSRTFWVAAIDINGNVGAQGSAALSITPPGASTVAAEVVDNNVLLRWSPATGSLPVDHYEARRGATWATAAVIGAMSGGFTTYFESNAGTYTYWVAAVDTAGNYGTPASTTALVSQPPDFKLLYDADQTLNGGTIANMVLDKGVLYAPINTAETFEQHFTSRTWASPQDQLTAGYEFFAEPSNADGHIEWAIDYGTAVASTMITVTAQYATLDGAPTLTPKISVSADNVSWTDFDDVWQTFATGFRYIKVRLTAASVGGDDLLKIERVNVKLAFKRRGDAGNGTAAASDTGGTVVYFNESFVDVEAIDVTPLATTPITAVYDFVDAPNPTSFKVLLFDASGNRTSGPFSWSAKGV